MIPEHLYYTRTVESHCVGGPLDGQKISIVMTMPLRADADPLHALGVKVTGGCYQLVLAETPLTNFVFRWEPDA